MQIDFLANVLGGEGPLHSLLIIAALLGMVLAVLIWGMEFSGWTISRHGFVRNNVQWNSTTIALIKREPLLPTPQQPPGRTPMHRNAYRSVNQLN